MQKNLPITATILLISLAPVLMACAPRDQDAQIARWDFDKATDGWKALNQCKVSAANGVLTIVSTGNDPHLAVDVSAPAGWKELAFPQNGGD